MTNTEQPPRGLRTFRIGAGILILSGAMHTFAVISVQFGEPQNELDAAYRQAARDFAFMEVGSRRATAFNGSQTLSASYSVLLIALGLIDLSLLRAAVAAGIAPRLIFLNLAATSVMLIIALVYFVPPAIFFMAIATIAFAAATFRHRPA